MIIKWIILFDVAVDAYLADLIFIGGIIQLGILTASAITPFCLKWRQELRPLPPILRQMFWVYGGYTAFSILVLGAISVAHSEQLASGKPLERHICLYIAAFWGVRLAFQAIFDVKLYLTRWYLKVGYHALTLCFAYLACVFLVAGMRRG